ncbi:MULTISPECIES: PQQ-binding-like beta-propeller repeat protein [Catenuloplanes]|uniref:Uncharacterized protein n=1 Tax=Catenuloplanes niger TaxID=587534 RepID=A0AAE3ZNN4_9ACTN|nr:hypothetical protein [Catenuloplanes niger]MDR7323269.1 hypothetical protein [Catenuloplanes niger]
MRRFAVMIVAVGVLGTGSPAHAIGSVPQHTPGFNGTVWATAYAGDTIYVGGDFTAAVVDGVQVRRSRLAAINARTGKLLDWAPAADGTVRAIATGGGAVYVGGTFGTIGATKRDGLAKLDGTTGTVSAMLNHTMTGAPYALLIAGNRLYAGGNLTEVNGESRGRLAAFSLGSGKLDPAWQPKADDQVQALASGGGRIYVGGRFKKINGIGGSPRIAALSPSGGTLDTGFKTKATVIVYGIAVGPTGVYAAHGGRGGTVAGYALDGTTRWTMTMDGNPQALALLTGTLYIGGHFDNICASTATGSQGSCKDGQTKRVKLAAADPSDGSLEPWTAHGNGVLGVLAMAASPALGTVAAGGAFTMINDTARKRFAQWSA